MPKIPLNRRRDSRKRLRLSDSPRRRLRRTLERSPDWGRWKNCRGKITGPCNQGYPNILFRVPAGSKTPVSIRFQIIVWDGEELTRHEATVSEVSTTDGKPDWCTDEVPGKITCIAYTRVAAWASLGA